MFVVDISNRILCNNGYPLHPWSPNNTVFGFGVTGCEQPKLEILCGLRGLEWQKFEPYVNILFNSSDDNYETLLLLYLNTHQ